jgi:hypothetical protein
LEAICGNNLSCCARISIKILVNNLSAATQLVKENTLTTPELATCFNYIPLKYMSAGITGIIGTHPDFDLFHPNCRAKLDALKNTYLLPVVLKHFVKQTLLTETEAKDLIGKLVQIELRGLENVEVAKQLELVDFKEVTAIVHQYTQE